MRCLAYVVRFLPNFCTDHEEVVLEQLQDQPKQVGCLSLGGLCRCALAGPQANGRKFDRELELSTWQLAWDGYALAATALGQLTLASTLKHKRMVMEIAANASSEEPSRFPVLVVLYDKLLRCTMSLCLLLVVACSGVFSSGFVGRT